MNLKVLKIGNFRAELIRRTTEDAELELRNMKEALKKKKMTSVNIGVVCMLCYGLVMNLKRLVVGG